LSETKFQVAVVDDDESFARAIGRLLRAAGFETTIYSSAEAFLQGAAAGTVNCLVLDIQMGGMSGLDLGRYLASIGAKIPVVFITALEDESAGRAVRQINCPAFLHKPVSGQVLIEAIRHAVQPA
jgi:FixJ family two-component response regulator